jgi:hypothetical protein
MTEIPLVDNAKFLRRAFGRALAHADHNHDIEPRAADGESLSN